MLLKDLVKQFAHQRVSVAEKDKEAASDKGNILKRRHSKTSHSLIITESSL